MLDGKLFAHFFYEERNEKDWFCGSQAGGKSRHTKQNKTIDERSVQETSIRDRALLYGNASDSNSAVGALQRYCGRFSTIPQEDRCGRIMMARRAILGILVLYKRYVSPLLPASCRFYPTCSAYATQAIEKYGIMRGAAIAVRRLLHCHPWNPGGYDPVP